MFIKKKDFEELKNRVEVLEFKTSYPNGLSLGCVTEHIQGIPIGCHYALYYVKDGKVKHFMLNGMFNRIKWKLLENNILKKTIMGRFEGLYEFDIENEMLIEIEEVEKPTKKKGGKNKNGIVDKKCGQNIIVKSK